MPKIIKKNIKKIFWSVADFDWSVRKGQIYFFKMAFGLLGREICFGVFFFIPPAIER